MSGSSTRKYLVYAFGEIVLIVFGILIALQINDWNEDRLDREREREFLASAVADLHFDIGRIDAVVSGNSILLDGLNRLLGLVSQASDGEQNFRELFTHSLVYTYWYLGSEWSQTTVARLESSDGLVLVRDRQVRDALLSYQQGLEACKHQYEEMKHYFHVMEESQKNLLDLSLGKPAYVYIEEDFLRILGPLQNFESRIMRGEYLIDDSDELLLRYYNDVLFYRTALNNTNAIVTAQGQLAKQLIEMIQNRYR